MPPLFELQRAGVVTPEGCILGGLDWCVRRGVVTALLGPSGTGKSLLLRGLSGRPLPPAWRLEGAWRHHGQDLGDPGLRTLAARHIAWLPQPHKAGVPTGAAPQGGWRSLFDSDAATLLLDEPTRGLAPADLAELGARLRALGPDRDVVLVTHDLAFARAVADDVALLCAGRFVAAGGAAAFFAAPPNELAQRFVRQGNCWPAGPQPPPLPSHFHWVMPGQLAGMGRPGLLGDADADLEAVAASGVGLLVTLTEDPLPAAKLRSVGLAGRHFPVPDMGVPALGPTAGLCRDVERAMRTSAVALHCHAGMGRTGTLLAAVRVWLGDDAASAVSAVRGVAPGYIQNSAQRDFVRRFAEAVGPRRR